MKKLIFLSISTLLFITANISALASDSTYDEAIFINTTPITTLSGLLSGVGVDQSISVPANGEKSTDVYNSFQENQIYAAWQDSTQKYFTNVNCPVSYTDNIDGSVMIFTLTSPTPGQYVCTTLQEGFSPSSSKKVK